MRDKGWRDIQSPYKHSSLLEIIHCQIAADKYQMPTTTMTLATLDEQLTKHTSTSTLEVF